LWVITRTIKQINNSSFKTVNELCEAFQVSRKDIRKALELDPGNTKYSKYVNILEDIQKEKE